jgi:hypothetical protein
MTGTSQYSSADSGGATSSMMSSPPLSGTAVSSSRPSPLRRDAVACTPTAMPSSSDMNMKLAKPPSPTAASAASPSVPTIAVSTRFMTFCDTIPPMIGRDNSRIRRRRSFLGSSRGRMGGTGGSKRASVPHASGTWKPCRKGVCAFAHWEPWKPCRKGICPLSDR